MALPPENHHPFYAMECPTCHCRECHAWPAQVPDLLPFHVCSRCGHIFRPVRRPSEPPSVDYQAGYLDGPDWAAKNRILAQDYWTKTAPLLAGLAPRRALEIGGAYGHFAALLRQSGIPEVVMAEVGKSAATFARSSLGLEVWEQSLQELSSQEPFDFVFSAHVIEHLEEPGLFFAKARRLLRPGGLCVALTPNASSWKARLLGPLWCWNSPDHEHFLSLQSARMLIEANGLEVVELRAVPAAAVHYPGLLVGLVSHAKNHWKARRKHRSPATAGGPASPSGKRWVNRLFRLLNGIAAGERLFWGD